MLVLFNIAIQSGGLRTDMMGESDDRGGDRHAEQTSVPSPADTGRAGPAFRPRIDVRDLLRGGRELILTYRDVEYRLRLTRKDKLILTK